MSPGALAHPYLSPSFCLQPVLLAMKCASFCSPPLTFSVSSALRRSPSLNTALNSRLEVQVRVYLYVMFLLSAFSTLLFGKERERSEDTSRSGRGFPCTPFPKPVSCLRVPGRGGYYDAAIYPGS